MPGVMLPAVNSVTVQARWAYKPSGCLLAINTRDASRIGVLLRALGGGVFQVGQVTA